VARSAQTLRDASTGTARAPQLLFPPLPDRSSEGGEFKSLHALTDPRPPRRRAVAQRCWLTVVRFWLAEGCFTKDLHSGIRFNSTSGRIKLISFNCLSVAKVLETFTIEELRRASGGNRRKDLNQSVKGHLNWRPILLSALLF
jgi:hypothetical protein